MSSLQPKSGASCATKGISKRSRLGGTISEKVKDGGNRINNCCKRWYVSFFTHVFTHNVTEFFLDQSLIFSFLSHCYFLNL